MKEADRRKKIHNNWQNTFTSISPHSEMLFPPDLGEYNTAIRSYGFLDDFGLALRHIIIIIIINHHYQSLSSSLSLFPSSSSSSSPTLETLSHTNRSFLCDNASYSKGNFRIMTDLRKFVESFNEQIRYTIRWGQYFCMVICSEGVE